jgi:hypothetical protein
MQLRLLVVQPTLFSTNQQITDHCAKAMETKDPRFCEAYVVSRIAICTEVPETLSKEGLLCHSYYRVKINLL